MLANEQKAEVANLCGDVSKAQSYLRVAADIADEIGDARKQAALRAGAAVLCAHLGAESVSAAEGAMLELSGSSWADVTPWLWLELALSACEPVAACRFVDRSEATVSENVHLAAVARIAGLRCGLLPGADEQTLCAAAEARAWLSDVVSPTEGRSVHTPPCAGPSRAMARAHDGERCHGHSLGRSGRGDASRPGGGSPATVVSKPSRTTWNVVTGSDRGSVDGRLTLRY